MTGYTAYLSIFPTDNFARLQCPEFDSIYQMSGQPVTAGRTTVSEILEIRQQSCHPMFSICSRDEIGHGQLSALSTSPAFQPFPRQMRVTRPDSSINAVQRV